MNAESGTPRLTDAEFLAQLLKDKKIFKSGTYPNNDKIKQLAFRLGAYRSFIEHRKAVISREKERHRRIRDALDVLIELLPGDRKEKEEQDARTAATWGPLAPTHEDDIATIDTLNSAAVDARVNMLFGPHLTLFGPPTEEWRDIAQCLDTDFNNILGDQPRDATYRFVQEIIPYLTGESPNYDAVRSAFMRGRLVNRGKSKRLLP
jgi:hypothetical protein